MGGKVGIGTFVALGSSKNSPGIPRSQIESSPLPRLCKLTYFFPFTGGNIDQNSIKTVVGELFVKYFKINFFIPNNKNQT